MLRPIERLFTCMSASLFTVQPENLKELWPQLEPKLQKALSRGAAWTAIDIAGQVLKGRAQIWGVWDEQIKSVWVTSISIYHEFSVCDVLSCGGDGLKDMVLYLKNVEVWAKEKGCSFVRIYGRKGWKRILPEYENTAVVLEKKL